MTRRWRRSPSGSAKCWRWSGQGLTNDEIGKALYLSPLTAKTHVSRMMAKLLARDRVQLVVIAYETGLVQPGRTSSCARSSCARRGCSRGSRQEPPAGRFANSARGRRWSHRVPNQGIHTPERQITS